MGKDTRMALCQPLPHDPLRLLACLLAQANVALLRTEHRQTQNLQPAAEPGSTAEKNREEAEGGGKKHHSKQASLPSCALCAVQETVDTFLSASGAGAAAGAGKKAPGPADRRDGPVRSDGVALLLGGPYGDEDGHGRGDALRGVRAGRRTVSVAMSVTGSVTGGGGGGNGVVQLPLCVQDVADWGRPSDKAFLKGPRGIFRAAVVLLDEGRRGVGRAHLSTFAAACQMAPRAWENKSHVYIRKGALWEANAEATTEETRRTSSAEARRIQKEAMVAFGRAAGNVGAE